MESLFFECLWRFMGNYGNVCQQQAIFNVLIVFEYVYKYIVLYTYQNKMPKKPKKIPKNKSYKTLPITKTKTFLTNLNTYLKLLRAQLQQTSINQYTQMMHKYLKKCSHHLRNYNLNHLSKCNQMINICKKCQKLILNKKDQVVCGECEDCYHERCFEGRGADEERICGLCERVREKNQRVSERIRNMLNREFERISNQEICSKCTQTIQTTTTTITKTKCLKCQHIYHKKCFGTHSIVCEKCFKAVQEVISQSQTLTMPNKVKQRTLQESFKKAKKIGIKRKSKIIKFGHIQNKQEYKQKEQKQQQQWQLNTDQNQKDDTTIKIKKEQLFSEDEQSTKIPNALNSQPKSKSKPKQKQKYKFKKGTLFQAIFPQMTKQQIQYYKKKLIEVIAIKNMQYTEELQPFQCQLQEDEDNSVDFVVSRLTANDAKIFQIYKEQPIGPFMFKYDSQMGFNVLADMDLPKGMIVCQYVGDVYSQRKLLTLQQNDSVMFLRKGKNADETLFIVPRKYTNIARYINGVHPDNKHQINVKNVKVRVQGRSAIILYTSRPIKKGENLYYNYNAGQFEQGYDTSQFL